ncbi:hypothetical protein BDQ17DRAFT_1404874 [Cyathus striatus]|nr:hypothetical protein BDQ17DRAFT_1404874 [Cyathus striatus]
MLCGEKLEENDGVGGRKVEVVQSRNVPLFSATMHHSPLPTKREFVIVTLLLVFLLYFCQSSSPLSHLALPANLSLSHTDLPTHPSSLPTRLSWQNPSQVPHTKILAHVPGWTLFDNLYIHNGTVFIVTDQPQSVPALDFVFSNSKFITAGNESIKARLPTDDNIQVISTKDATRRFGAGAGIIDGVTFFVNDPPQFITHYYHCRGNTSLPAVRHLFFPRLDNFHWRDYASMNEWVVRSSFPGVTMEFVDDWRDRIEMGSAFVFDRVLVADRSAAMAYSSTSNGLAGSVNWWMPIRNNVVMMAGMEPQVGGGTTSTPVITYISRQEWGRRMLIQKDHEKLVEQLYKLRDEYGYEVNIVVAEHMSRVEQIRLAARTTIMMGVHGNGLTSLIWMKPNPRSTVMEFFYPEGFAHDYEYTTRALGMTHYGFWGGEYFTAPGIPTPSYPEGFQGNEIPIDGEVVARLCVERLSLSSEVDD